MESLADWARARGFTIEPYGLDLSPRIAALARARYPAWADRVYVGNAINWEPPRRFDFIGTELVYVPEHRHRDFVERLLDRVSAPGGRLIVCGYGSSRAPTPAAEMVGDTLRSRGFVVAGEAEAADLNGVVFTRIAWIDAGSSGGF